ncbi:MAG: spore cortex biosynthesis protein YabQ [Oscillospiraceae bacterium]
MVYSIPDCFMTAFAVGLVFALVYEALRIVRILLPFRAVTFLCDVLFFLLAAVAVTKLSLVLGNYIRGYTVLGFGAGVFTYITTVGRIINRLENAVADAVRTVLGAFFRALGSAFRSGFGLIAHKVHIVFGTIHKIWLNAGKKLRKPLKIKPQMVYNNKSTNKISRGSETGNVIQAKVKRSNNA